MLDHELPRQELEAEVVQLRERVVVLESAIRQYLDEAGCNHPECTEDVDDGGKISVGVCGEAGLCDALYKRRGVDKRAVWEREASDETMGDH